MDIDSSVAVLPQNDTVRIQASLPKSNLAPEPMSDHTRPTLF
jgi:hypothetical protein